MLSLWELTPRKEKQRSGRRRDTEHKSKIITNGAKITLGLFDACWHKSTARMVYLK